MADIVAKVGGKRAIPGGWAFLTSAQAPTAPPLALRAAGVNALRRNAYTTPRLRNALCGHIRWTRGQLGKPAQILSDGCQGELELGAPWPAQAQPAETQDALEMREQHFHLLAVAPGAGRNAEVDFHGQKRSNETHASRTDPEARLYRKGRGKEAKLCFMGHALMENRNGWWSMPASLRPTAMRSGKPHSP
jgi:hypothetical protein